MRTRYGNEYTKQDVAEHKEMMDQRNADANTEIEVFYVEEWVEWEPEDILYQNEGTEFFPAWCDQDGNVKGLTLEEAVKAAGVKEFTLCRQNFTCRARVV